MALWSLLCSTPWLLLYFLFCFRAIYLTTFRAISMATVLQLIKLGRSQRGAGEGVLGRSLLAAPALLSLDFSGVPNRLRNCPAAVREPDPDP